MTATGKSTANITGVSILIIVKATTVLKNCNMVILKLNISETSDVSKSRENLFKILPIGVVSEN